MLFKIPTRSVTLGIRHRWVNPDRVQQVTVQQYRDTDKNADRYVVVFDGVRSLPFDTEEEAVALVDSFVECLTNYWKSTVAKEQAYDTVLDMPIVEEEDRSYLHTIECRRCSAEVNVPEDVAEVWTCPNCRGKTLS